MNQAHAAGRSRAALGVAGLSLLALVLAACGRGEALANNQGNDAFAAGDYAVALQEYAKVQEEDPERSEPFYNSANVHYRNDEQDQARDDLRHALVNADEDLARATLFNQGNSFFETKEFDRAVESYEEVLRMDPGDQDAKHNLELALKQQQGKQDADQQQNGPGKDGEQQDQGQQDPGQQGSQDQPGSQQGENDQGGGDQQGEPQNQPSPGKGEQANSGDQGNAEPGPGEVQQPELSEEQARRLLDSVGRSTETLQNALQRTFAFSPGDAPERDW